MKIILILLILLQFNVLGFISYNYNSLTRYDNKIYSQISTSDIITSINDIQIIAKEADIDINSNNDNNNNIIQLVDVSSGWGNGNHHIQ